VPDLQRALSEWWAERQNVLENRAVVGEVEISLVVGGGEGGVVVGGEGWVLCSRGSDGRADGGFVSFRADAF